MIRYFRLLWAPLLVASLASCSPCPSTYTTHTWTKAEERQAAAELRALPEDSIVAAMLIEYYRMRANSQAF